MTTGAVEKLEQTISGRLDELIKALKTSTCVMASINIFAAKIQSAKTDYERNEAIKEAQETLETMKKSLEEP